MINFWTNERNKIKGQNVVKGGEKNDKDVGSYTTDQFTLSINFSKERPV
jgi:hypothetical protein